MTIKKDITEEVRKRHALGKCSELQAQIWFMKKGYQVYPESRQSPIDFIAVHPIKGDIHFIEVKTTTRRNLDNTKIHKILNKRQKKLNDILLEKYGLKIDLIYVDRDKGVEEPCLSYLSIS